MTPPQNPAPQGQQPPMNPGAAPAPAPVAEAPKPSFFEAFKPEPSKAPPLEWVALVVGVVLALSSLFPWRVGEGVSQSGLDFGDGWVVLGAGLISLVMGFVGLSRDSIALAAGQAVIGIICVVYSLLNISAGDTTLDAGWGVIVALISAIILTVLSLYNAFDAYRKGAKF
jgi:hypothetical protein